MTSFFGKYNRNFIGTKISVIKLDSKELGIPVKARLDGEYVNKMSLFFDAKCILGTITCVLKSDGIREGRKSN